ncbi:MAG: hypothetical protein JWN40_5170 [Phycisphaerales bacterium]|nr:hypothetical protein [Phycisphaerales bacterium]
MIKIPFEELSAEVLEALIEEFVSRDGTDLAEAGAKIAQVRAQLRSGAVVIVYDEASESANIVSKDYRPPAASEEEEAPRVVYDEEMPRDFSE